MDCSPSSPPFMRFPRQEYWSRLSFLQEIFPIQRLNPCLLHWQADALLLSHQGSPFAFLNSIKNLNPCFSLSIPSRLCFSNFIPLGIFGRINETYLSGVSILLYNFEKKHYFHIKTNVQNNAVNQLYSSKN